MNNDYFARAKKVITDPQVLSVVAAKRAKQLASGGHRPMIKCDSPNLLEIAEGLLGYDMKDDAELKLEAEAEAAAEETN